jgi:aminopeptidase N
LTYRAVIFSLLVPLVISGGCAAAQSVASSGAVTPASDGEHPYRPGIDVLDYALSLELPEWGNGVRGDAILTVQRTARIGELVLDLVRLAVDSVRVNGRRVPFARTTDAIRIPLPAGSSKRFAVEVAYHGAVEDGLIIRTDSAGRWTGFGDNWPNRARFWIPSVDHPSDKATVTWHVTAPAKRMVISNGVLLERTTLADGRVRTSWRESHPVPVYVIVIAAAPLVEYSLGETACGLGSDGRCVPQFVYTAPEQRTTLPGAFAQAGEIVRYFASLVGPFPYERLAHLQSSTRFGGMENATAIFYSDAAFRRGTMGEGLIAHETAHQWFGDAVTEREWSHVWLSEGFATYFAALWTRHARGEDAFRNEMRRIRGRILEDSEAVPKRPVIDTAQTELLGLLNRNSYEKGGFVLHMLRSQVGDSAFFSALRAYYKAHRDSTALTDDLRLEMERASGQQLGWFFEQWLRRPGFPELDVTWSYDSSSHQVTLDVGQRGRFGPYRLPLTLELSDDRGVARRATVVVPAQEHVRLVLPDSVHLASAPRSVVADPDVELLARIEIHPNR